MGDAAKADSKKKKDEGAKKPATFRESVTTMPVWKKTAMVLALIVVSVSLVLQVSASNMRPEGVPSAREASKSTTSAFRAQSLVAGQPDPTGGGGDARAGEDGSGGEGGAGRLEEAEPMDVYSLGVLRLSFSFFAGLAIAHFLRTLLKATLIGAGFLILGLFALQYAGFVEVRWDAISARYETFGAWAGDQFESFRTFITGYLPSVGAGAVGAVFGFKKT